MMELGYCYSWVILEKFPVCLLIRKKLFWWRFETSETILVYEIGACLHTLFHGMDWVNLDFAYCMINEWRAWEIHGLFGSSIDVFVVQPGHPRLGVSNHIGLHFTLSLYHYQRDFLVRDLSIDHDYAPEFPNY